MEYADAIAQRAVTPVALARLTLDWCGRSFGVPPCTGTGAPCYHTWATCRSKSAFLLESKPYEYCTNGPLPFPGPKPFIVSVDYMPTEIKTSLTVANRVKVHLLDAADLGGEDVGMDPYLRARDGSGSGFKPDPGQFRGTYWKKFLARNKYVKGRPFSLSDGVLGIPRDQFRQRFKGVLVNITFPSEGALTIEATDVLKKLDDFEMPPKLDTKLMAAIDGAATGLTVNDVTGFPASGYVRIGDEVIAYASKDDSTGQLFTLTRGAWNTAAAEHKEKDKVQICEYFAPATAYDHMQTILARRIDLSDIDTPAFEGLKGFPVEGINLCTLVTEPTKASTLYWELVELEDCNSWVDERLKVTIRKRLPNLPGRTYADLNDTAHMEEQTGKVDLNETATYTRCFIYWDFSVIGKMGREGNFAKRNTSGDAKDFARLDGAIDADAESPQENNEEIVKTIYCRWIRPGYDPEAVVDAYVGDLAMRLVAGHREAMPLLSFGLSFKDRELLTGDYVRLTTDIMENADGSPLTACRHQIVKRTPRDDGSLDVTCLRLSDRRIAYWAPEGLPDYGEVSEDDKEYWYWADENGLMPDGTPGYCLY